MIMQRYVFTLAVWSCILSHNLLLYCNMYTRSTLNYTILPDTVLQGVLRMDGEEIQHEFIYVDEAGFNLTRTRRRGRNIIGHRAIVNVPGQRGGNITLCAAITQNGVLHRHAHMGPYNTALILTFLDQLHNIAANQIDHMQYFVVWDNVSFHRSALVQNWFQQHPHFTVLYLPPYSPFLNPTEEFFSAWRWKVYDLRLQAEVPLIQAMEEACDQMEVAAMQGWIRHSRRFFPRCLANDNIACDVDEILWPDPARRRDNVFFLMFLCFFFYSKLTVQYVKWHFVTVLWISMSTFWACWEINEFLQSATLVLCSGWWIYIIFVLCWW